MYTVYVAAGRARDGRGRGLCGEGVRCREKQGAVGLGWGGGGGLIRMRAASSPGRNFLCVLLVLYTTSLLESPMLKQVKKGK